MTSLTDIEFQNLLGQSIREWFSEGTEATIYNTEEDEFYFYYDVKEGKITTQGEVVLSGEQFEKLLTSFTEFIEENPASDNYAFGETTDPYSEHGVDRQMFI